MKKRKFISEINITPFVDVMLVLVVIFMITAPSLILQIPISLPNSSSAKTIPTTAPIFVSVDVNGNIYVQDEKVQQANLEEKLSKLAKLGDIIYIRGDKNTHYGQMINIMNMIKQFNYEVSLVTE